MPRETNIINHTTFEIDEQTGIIRRTIMLPKICESTTKFFLVKDSKSLEGLYGRLILLSTSSTMQSMSECWCHPHQSLTQSVAKCWQRIIFDNLMRTPLAKVY